ncbi:MAG: hypothetical protein ACFB0E_19080 [Leptolyngbyaceae cyanobacterium]
MSDRILPRITIKANEEYGSRLAAKWRQLKAPETPYILRHAYTVCRYYADCKLDSVADWMGHNADRHLKRYHRWIAEKNPREE